ncbi:MAG: transmembrane 220 family protein [Gammaproteobacteria bacterium]
MRAVHLIFAVLFAISAGLQYNDPDPVGWALMYLAATVLAAGAFRGVTWARPVAIALAAVCVVWMVTLAPGMGAFIERGDPSLLAATMQAGDPVIEEAREFLGLGIVLLYCLVAAVRKPAR